MRLTIDVLGHPRPQGSKRAFLHPSTGRAMMTEQTGQGLRTWREDVKHAALDAIASYNDPDDPMRHFPLDGPVHVDVRFRLPRPKAHYRSGRNAHLLRESAPPFPVGRNVGDIEKLVRSTHDALTTAGVWADDSQVAICHAAKLYCLPDQQPGARIVVTTLDQSIGALVDRAIDDVQETLL